MGKSGRPPAYNTATELDAALEKYFEDCDERKLMPNKAGMFLALKISDATWSNYRKKPDFLESIKRAERTIENAWVQRLNAPAPTGAIFYLKNAFKETYKDRHETDLTSKGEKLATVVMLPPRHADGDSLETKQ